MPESDLAQLARDIDALCRLRGEFTLRSRQVSNENFDKYIDRSQPGGSQLGAEGIAVRSVLTKDQLDAVSC
jgi:hypothetical protein